METSTFGGSGGIWQSCERRRNPKTVVGTVLYQHVPDYCSEYRDDNGREGGSNDERRPKVAHGDPAEAG